MGKVVPRSDGALYPRKPISDHDELKAFSYEGFEYNPNIGEELYPHFVRELP